MTQTDFKKLKPGNIITTLSGTQKFMVTHTLVDASGDVSVVSMERAAQVSDAGGYEIVQQDQLVECIQDETVLGTGE